MATPAIDYTSRDFEAIRNSIVSYLQTKYPTTFRDVTESGLGMALIEVLCYVADLLSFQLDYAANECFITTARDRYNVMNLGKLVGYKMRTATSASVNVTAKIDATQAQRVEIREGTVVTTSKGVIFRVLETQYIDIGQTEGDVVFVQGELQGDSFSFPSGTASWQKFTLSNPGVVYGSVEVYVDGDKWSEVNSLVFCDSSSKSYTIDYDDDDVATIQFGDGDNGQVPPPESSIEVSYRTGGGISGNINIGEINVTVSGYLEGVAPETEVQVSLYNYERGSGGEERESVQHAKMWIPYWIRTAGRAVTLDDFNTLANAFSDPVYGAFSFVSAKLAQEIPESNLVELYGWARGSANEIVAPSEGLKQALQDYFSNNGEGAVRLVCVDCEVLDGENIYIDIDLSVSPESDFSQAEIFALVRKNIDELFLSGVFPGRAFRVSTLYSIVMSTPGVSYCLINEIVASKLNDYFFVEGDGGVSYSGTIDIEEGLRIIPGSVRIYVSEDTLAVDDGEGNFSLEGTTTTGSIDYSTGDWSIDFEDAVGSGVSVSVEFREVIDYQRGEELTSAPGGVSRFKGKVKYSPIVPLTLGLKGIAFSDGSQVVIDDGDGNLVGDVSPLGVNRIDYSTGSYDFTFTTSPVAGSKINATYRQELSTSSGDLPMFENQLPVKGSVSISKT